MTGILILLGMNVILWKILVKLMFAKKLARQGGKAALPCDVLCYAGLIDEMEYLDALLFTVGKRK